MARYLLVAGACALALAACSKTGSKGSGEAKAPAPAAPTDMSEGVSNDGGVYPVPPAGSSSSAMEASAAPTAPATPEMDSDADYQRLLKLPALTKTPIDVESVFPPDGRAKVGNTRRFPESAQVLVELPNGRCSGAMIGKDLVLTAGHCVHTGRGGKWQDWAKVYPGKDGRSSPYGSCMAKKLYSVVGWTQNSDPNYDIGAIKLDCKVGEQSGWMGFFWQTATLVGADARISSYPGDKPLEQWTHTEPVASDTATQTRYRTDTKPGNSGSGVFAGRGAPSGCGGACVHTAHAYGGSSANAGTRITRPLFENLVRWKNEP